MLIGIPIGTVLMGFMRCAMWGFAGGPHRILEENVLKRIIGRVLAWNVPASWVSGSPERLGRLRILREKLDHRFR